MKGQRVTQNIRQFVYAGNATFTLLNTQTRLRMTFKVSKAKDKPFYYVKWMYGSDNDKDFRYLGFAKDGMLHKGPKGMLGKPFDAFQWLLKHIDGLSAPMEFWHEGLCAKCGRKLTVPDSIRAGIGPSCQKQLNKQRESRFNYEN